MKLVSFTICCCLLAGVIVGLIGSCLAQDFEFGLAVDGVANVDSLYTKSHEPPLTNFVIKLMDATGHGGSSRKHIKTLLADDPVSDGIDVNQTACALITRSGFKFELYDSISNDGYITQLIRLINPLADKSELKYPPVVLYAGQFATPAFFLMGPYQHPAPWPLANHQNSIASRSLAFTLSNNGYDVWLVPARGVDKLNQGRVDPMELRLFEGAEVANKHSKRKQYWAFSYDEIVQHEFKNQLELVKKVTNQAKVSLITYSNGGLIALAFMTENSDYSRDHIDMHISIAPTVYVSRSNFYHKLAGLYGNYLASMESPIVDENIDSITRNGLSFVCKHKIIRYTACKFMLDAIFGHSDMFQTYFELDLLQHIARPQSVKSVRQSMQTSNFDSLKHFDYGSDENNRIYGINFPPTYNLDRVDHPRMFIFSGDRDAIADEVRIGKLIRKLGGKKAENFIIEGYNHLDLIAAWNVDKKINEPILGLLDERFTELSYSD